MTGLLGWCNSVHVGGSSSADGENESRCHIVACGTGSQLHVADSYLPELGGEVPCRHGDVYGRSGESAAVCPHPNGGLSSSGYVRKITFS